MTQIILTYSFYILFLLTPLIWTPLNYELFEYNKMMVVYFLTIIITTTWILKIINNKSLILNRTPLDFPILLFLTANILSTIFSIDTHTSIWGYYSRSNGGLISIISYIILFYALVSNFGIKEVLNFLKLSVIGGFLVALYAIPEHFGISPSCVILTGNLSANCWVQDVQARVFATLGQPNWLGAYLAMIIFPAFYFLLQAKKKFQKAFYIFILITLYLAFTFTYSRGATLGFLAGLGVILSFWLVQNQSRIPLLNRFWRPRIARPQNDSINWRSIFLVLAIFLAINILFGSALTRFKLFIDSPTPPKTSITAVTQLESGGTESGQIRLIVWQGALDIFKHFPFLGSGVETFAYSYYQFRPASHNLVSEWDFLYNKAHNEYLNYLANTGILGFLSYLAIIITFIIWSIKKVLSFEFKVQSEKQNSLLTANYLLLTTILASYVSYLVQNFFGFSVVIIAVLFYLFPGVVFVTSNTTQEFKLSKLALKIINSFNYQRALTIVAYIAFFPFSLLTFIFGRQLLNILTKFYTIAFGIYLLFTLSRFWMADTYFAKGSNYLDLGNAGQAYNQLVIATNLNSGEPLYKSELGYAAAASAVALSEDEATLAAQIKDLAIKQTTEALNLSPKNVSFFRTAIRTYYALAEIDTEYNEKTLQVLDKTISLAPTDAKLYYNKALILGSLERNDEAIEYFKKALDLKPNYRDAHFALGVFYENKEEIDLAKKQMEIVLQLIPEDKEAEEKLNTLNSR